MTAAAFAALVRARPIGRGRWEATCPSHPDHSPSLAIREGKEGRVLVRCWAGCSLPAILAALGLTVRDLFNDAPSKPQAAAFARKAHAERDARERAHWAAERKLSALVRRLHFAVLVLAARLARAPEGDDRLAALLHTALDWLRRAKSGLDAHA